MRISDWSSDVCSSDLPAPIAASTAVVDLLWPAVGNALAEIRLALPREFRQMLLNGGCELLGIEAEGGEVIGSANLDGRCWRFHQPKGPCHRIRHVHHGKCRASIQKAGVCITSGSLLEDIHCINGCSSAGQRGSADKSGI